MFDPDSRYDALGTAEFVRADGRVIRYKRRRFLPRGEDLLTLAEVRVIDGDRIDLIAARTLGDPLQFWRICDANEAMDPQELLAEPGRLVRVPMPQP